MLTTSIVMLVWEELLHYIGKRLVLLTEKELENLRTISFDDVVKHLRDLAAKAEGQNGGSVPTEPPSHLLPNAALPQPEKDRS